MNCRFFSASVTSARRGSHWKVQRQIRARKMVRTGRRLAVSLRHSSRAVRNCERSVKWLGIRRNEV